MKQQKLFGTSGIRGYAEETSAPDYISLTDSFCYAITRAFLAYAAPQSRKGVFAIGMDLRPSSPHIKDAVIQAITDEGCDVSFQGITPTPALAYYVKEKKCAGGIMITGSHIPEHMNGIKFFLPSGEILKDDEAALEKIYAELEHITPLVRANAVAESSDANSLYTELLRKHAVKITHTKQRPFNGLKVVVDGRSSCQSLVIPGVLRLLGATVHELPPADRFIAVDTEKTTAHPELAAALKEHNADVGVVYDGDGDRVVFYQKDGTLIVPDVICTLIARNPSFEAIVTPINVSSVIDCLNKEVVRTKVGAPYVVSQMKQLLAEGTKCFGFESNGGSIFGDYHFSRDGGIPTIEVLNWLRHRPLHEVRKDVPVYHQLKDKFDCPTALNEPILERCQQEFIAKFDDHVAGVETMDGVKILFKNNAWILFRPSQNAPEFRIFTEARTKEQAEYLMNMGTEFVKGIMVSA